MSTTLYPADSESAFDGPGIPENLRARAPSAKLIAKILEDSEPLSRGQLATKSLLLNWTVRYALDRLRDADLVASRHSF